MSKSITLTIAIVLAICLALTNAKNLYGDHKYSVTPLSRSNWENVIVKGRSRIVSIVHFYKYTDYESKEFAEKFKEESLKSDGIYRFGGVDCDEHYDICEKQSVTKFPTVKIYPTLPAPDFQHEGQLDLEAILKVASRYVPSNVIKITSANIDTFIQENPAVPKVLLFTEKKGIPLIFKALSKSLEKKQAFGIVSSTEEDGLMKRFKIQKTPQIIVVKTNNEKKPDFYNGGINFKEIFNFLNVHSETFVPGGGSTQDSKATKAWLTEVVPELTFQSAKDICLNVPNVLCVILLSDGQPDKDHVDTLKDLHKLFERKIDRGTKYNFMWLDTKVENEFGSIFDVPKKPSVVILNPGRRKRYVPHPDEISVDSLKETFDKIAGGDMKFTNIKGDLPEMKARL